MPFVFTKNIYEILVKGWGTPLASFHIRTIPGARRQLPQLFVPFGVFRQKDKVPILIGIFIFTLVYKINFITEDNLEVWVFVSYLIPAIQCFNMSANDLVIGNGQTIETIFDGLVNHSWYFVEAVSQFQIRHFSMVVYRTEHLCLLFVFFNSILCV